MIEANHPMLTVSEDNLTKPKAGVAVLEGHVPGSAHSEQTLMIKLEPNMEDYQTLSQLGTSNGPATSEQCQLWTTGEETSTDPTEQNICALALVPDVSCQSSRPYEAADKKQECTSTRKNLPFFNHKPSGELMTSDQLVMGIQSTSELTLAPVVHDQTRKQEIVIHEFTITNNRPHKGDVFEVNPIASGDLEESSKQDFSGHNCFICSSCGKSFDSFSVFQMHQCNNLT